MKTLILAKYYGPTTHKGARIKCASGHGVTWHPFRYGANDPFTNAAISHAEKFGLGTPERVDGRDFDERAFVA